jgi:hypothetical protein
MVLGGQPCTEPNTRVFKTTQIILLSKTMKEPAQNSETRTPGSRKPISASDLRAKKSTPKKDQGWPYVGMMNEKITQTE